MAYAHNIGHLGVLKLGPGPSAGYFWHDAPRVNFTALCHSHLPRYRQSDDHYRVLTHWTQPEEPRRAPKKAEPVK